MLALRARQGPYRFLVRRWDGVSDIELASRLLTTEFFEKELQPLPLPVEELDALLLLAPHQDDELIGAGGTLLRARQAGAAVHVLYLTDGAQANVGYASSEAESAAIRDREAATVCKRLGANKHDLGLANIWPRPQRADLERLAALIRDIAPQVVLTPWLLDNPAKHRLANHLLWLTDRLHRLDGFEVWGYQVHNSLLPNGLVDITAVAEEKRALLTCYRSQNEHCQRYDHLGMALSAWSSRFLPHAPEARYAELFFTLPVRAFLAQVERLYLPDLATTYRQHGPVLAGARALHKAITGEEPGP